MYIAMNRFKVAKGREAEFEEMWMTRDSYLNEVPGFLEFHLLRGPERDDHRLYTSHSMWESYDAFQNWTRSEAFRKAHANAGTTTEGVTLEAPAFEGFEVVGEIKPEG
jgi:heme-degrading monooxygenase HmoA